MAERSPCAALTDRCRCRRRIADRGDLGPPVFRYPRRPGRAGTPSGRGWIDRRPARRGSATWRGCTSPDTPPRHDLRNVDLGALGSTRTATWTRDRATASIAIARDALDAPAQAALEDALGRFDPGPDGSRAVVHGDFAPVNVILDPAGEIVALLDFEHARIGPSLLDVAWWGWVVRHHHPEAWSAAWTTFLTAAGVEPGPTIEREVRSLQVLRLLESVAASEDGTTRTKWLGRLSEAVAS
jgi:hypothetical protein